MANLTITPSMPVTTGYTSMFVYKQDPSFEELGKRRVLILSDVRPGPEDDLVRVIDAPIVRKDERGDFISAPVQANGKKVPIQSIEFDAVHAFAVCRQVLEMYQRAFLRLGRYEHESGNRLKILNSKDLKDGQYDFLGKWGKPLDLYIRAYAGRLIAIYTAGRHNAIDFGYNEEKGIYACRSFDIIAHETGHAVLDAIWKDVKVQRSLERGALEEAFGDLTVLFTLLSHLDMCDTAIAYSKAKLDAPQFFLNQLAEQFGMAKGRKFALRDIGKPCKISDADPNNRYELSLVFSSAIYCFIITVFEDHKQPERYSLAETLFRVGRYINTLTLGAFYLTAQNPSLTFATVAQEMIMLLHQMRSPDIIGNINDRKRWADNLSHIFQEHEILVSSK